MTAQAKLMVGMRFEGEAGSGHHVALDALALSHNKATLYSILLQQMNMPILVNI